MSFLPVRLIVKLIGASKCRPMPSEFSVCPVSHDPYLDIEILLSPRINKTAPTFIGTVPCRLMEKDFDLIVVHDYLFLKPRFTDTLNADIIRSPR